MIDYHKKQTFKTDDRVYAHDIGFSGVVTDAFPGDSIESDLFVVEFDTKSYGDHSNFQRLVIFKATDLFHVCDTEAELTPKPTSTHKYLLEDTEYQGAFDMNGDN